jgi:RhtB (resistance to homoserine/threonine) family protein
MNTASIVTVTLIGLLAVVSPGPDFLIVTRNTLMHSRRVGLCTAWGIALGTMWWVAASLLGISYLISRTVVAFNAIKWLGALYLVWIGIQSLRAKKAPVSAVENSTSPRELAPSAAFRNGLLTNLLNPKAALFFVSFFGVIITPETTLGWRCFYGLEISLIALSWFSLVATVLSVGSVKSFFDRWSAWIERATGALLIALGVKLALYSRK